MSEGKQPNMRQDITTDPAWVCPPHIEQRFWSRVDKSDDCWLWISDRAPRGYGRMSIKEKSYRANRLAYVLTRGAILPGLVVCHTCDNPPCCNPDHLFLATNEENSYDRHRKGRDAQGEQITKNRNTATGERHGSHLYPERWKNRGSERSSFAHFTWEQVRTIRARYAAGGTSYPRLAAEYAVDPETIARIVRGETWKE